MKLKNKKTGEIRDFNAVIHELNMFGSLAELNEYWEDYEEPKVYYVIFETGEIKWFHNGDFPEIEKLEKQFGNYFTTKEEAEKVVEKLKAWKRLKDKGFHPVNCTVEHFGREILVHFIIEQPYDEKDLVLLFGGKK